MISYMGYRRNDRKIGTLIKRNTKLYNTISNVLTNDGDPKIIKKCFDDIKYNQTQIDYLIRRNSLRTRTIGKKIGFYK